jgi:hypothetical protein
VPLTSVDKREHFLLDANRGRIKLTQCTFQNRARVAIVLYRLDIDGPTHYTRTARKSPALTCMFTAEASAINGQRRRRPISFRTRLICS